MNAPPEASPRRPAWWLLGAIVVAGLALRLWGTTFGLPYEYHVDESLYRLTAKVSRTRIHAHFGPFQILVLGLRWLVERAQPLTGRLALPPRIAATLTAPSLFELLGRLVSAVCGALTAVPLYWIGKRLWNEATGLLAAFFLAVCFSHARSSHYAVPDAMACLLIVLAAWYCIRLAPDGPARPYLLAGLYTGLAFPTKELCWPLFLLIGLCHLLPERQAAAARSSGGESGEGGGGDEAGRAGPPRRWLARLASWKLLAAYAVALATWVVTSPQVVLLPRATFAFWKAAAELGAKGGMDRLQLDPGPPWRFYLASLGWGMGPILTVLSLAGVVLVFAGRRPRQAALMLCFPVLYVAFLLKPHNMYFARYALGAVPFLLLAAAALLWRALGWMRLSGRTRTAAAALLALAAAAEPTYHLVLHDRVLEREDTRTLAKRWIEANVPEGASVLLESWWFGPQLASAAHPVPFSARTYRVKMLGPYGLSEKHQAFGPSGGTPTVADYAAQGIEYVVSNSITSESRLLDPREDEAKREFYRSLDRDARLVWKISPYAGDFVAPRVFEHTYGPATFLDRLARPGPVIKIYRLPPAAGGADAGAGAGAGSAMP